MTPSTPERMLNELLAEAGEPGPVHVLLVRAEPSYVALVFDGEHPEPRFVFKATHDAGPARLLRREYDALTALRTERPTSFGSTVPAPLGSRRDGRLEGFLVTALPGGRLKDLPPEQPFGPRAIDETLGTVTDWLFRYYGLDEKRIDLSGELVRTLFEDPARRYFELFETTAEEKAAIEAALGSVTRAAAGSIPACPAHGDFSPANVIWNEGRMGVIDFEFAFETAPPLDDLVHFLGSLRSSRGSAGRTAGRRRLFEEVFYTDGTLGRAARRSVFSFAKRIGLSPDFVEPLFVLAWVRLAVRNVHLRIEASGLGELASDSKRLWERLDAETGESLPVLRMRGGVCDNLRQYVALRDRCVFR